MRRIEDRRAELTAVITAAEVEPSLPAFHPNMADVFRQKTEMLAAALERDAAADVAGYDRPQPSVVEYDTLVSCEGGR